MSSISVSMLAGLYSFRTYTRVVLIIQAALSRPDMVQALGHDVPRIFTLAFAGGTALAGLAGVIGGNALVTEPGMADAVGSIVFVVVVVGGLGSLTGAFVASLLIGILQTFMVGMNYSFVDFAREFGLDIHPPPLPARLSLTQFAPVMPYLLMVAILIFRPR